MHVIQRMEAGILGMITLVISIVILILVIRVLISLKNK